MTASRSATTRSGIGAAVVAVVLAVVLLIVSVVGLVSTTAQLADLAPSTIAIIAWSQITALVATALVLAYTVVVLLLTVLGRPGTTFMIAIALSLTAAMATYTVLALAAVPLAVEVSDDVTMVAIAVTGLGVMLSVAGAVAGASVAGAWIRRHRRGVVGVAAVGLPPAVLETVVALGNLVKIALANGGDLDPLLDGARDGTLIVELALGIVAPVIVALVAGLVTAALVILPGRRVVSADAPHSSR